MSDDVKYIAPLYRRIAVAFRLARRVFFLALTHLRNPNLQGGDVIKFNVSIDIEAPKEKP